MNHWSRNVVKSVQYYDINKNWNWNKIFNPQSFNVPLTSLSIHPSKKYQKVNHTLTQASLDNFNMWELLPALDLSMSTDVVLDYP
ncbi:hypothetical protein HMI56_003643 [Coelomomyces lativittatus]|nr:hypothetical protein HMI56_003643 [Coelomomyces lativittatus]